MKNRQKQGLTSPILTNRANWNGELPAYINPALQNKPNTTTSGNWFTNLLSGITNLSQTAGQAYTNISPILGINQPNNSPIMNNGGNATQTDANEGKSNTKLYIFGGIALLVIVVLLILIFRKK